MRVINKNYDRSIKEPSLSPPGGIHTQGLALASTCHLQQGEIKPRVLNYTQQDLPDMRKTKDSKDMQDLFGLWIITSAEALLNMRPYIQF